MSVKEYMYYIPYFCLVTLSQTVFRSRMSDGWYGMLQQLVCLHFQLKIAKNKNNKTSDCL